MSLSTGGLSLALDSQETIAFDPNWINEQESRNICMDTATKSFANISDMSEFLSEREGNAGWLNGIDIKDLNLVLLDDAEDVLNAASQEVILDTKKNTGLCLTGGDLQQTALRSCAIPSLLERAKISGAALNKVSKLVLRNIVNECLQVAAKSSSTKIRLADGKISAVLSSEYAPIFMPQIFTAATEYIEKRFPNNCFAGGTWSHVITTGEWELTGEDSLIEAYKNALIKHGIKHDEIQPGLRLSSSDTGVSGVNLMPKIVVGKDRLLLPIGGPIGLEHKGNASLEKFKENLEGIFALYGDRLERLAQLLEVEINNPINCMSLVMKRLGVPKKYGTPALEVFQRGIAYGDSCTAHDIFYGLGELLFQLQIHNVSGENVLRMEETIAKALTLNITEYDVPDEVEKGGVLYAA